ncbi:protein of unknown function [Burkholderia multivorans]
MAIARTRAFERPLCFANGLLLPAVQEFPRGFSYTHEKFHIFFDWAGW